MSHLRFPLIFLLLAILITAVHPQSSLAAQAAPLETGVYIETFTTNTARRYTERADWNVWSQSLQLGLVDGSDMQLNAAAASLGNGENIAVWSSNRFGKSGIWAQKIDADGNRLWQTDRQVSQAAGGQQYPTVTADSQGNAIAIWEDGRSNGGGATRIVAQKVDANGSKLWQGDVLITASASPAERAAASAGDNGTFYVAWKDVRNSGSNIYVQKFDQNGIALWPTDLRVNSDSGLKAHSNPAVVPAGAGIFVTWVDLRNDTSNIYAQKLSADGSKLWTEDVRVDSGPDGTSHYNPAAAAGNDNNIFVIWGDNRNYASSDSDIYAQQIGPDGVRRWTADLRVNAYPGNAEQQGPAVAVDHNGNAVVAWHDNRNNRSNGDIDIYAQKLSPAGQREWAEDVRVGQSGVFSQSGAVVSSGAPGAMFVLWQDGRNGYSDIYAQKLDDAGNNFLPADIRVSGDTGESIQSNPVAAVYADGSVLVAWEDKRNGKADIYAQKLSPVGSKRWAADIKVNSDPLNTQQDSPAVALDSNGNAVIAWVDNRNGNGDIYAQELDENGNRLWLQDVRVNCDLGPAQQLNVAVTLDSSGNAVIVWRDERNRTDFMTQDADIYAQKLDQTGAKVWAGDIRVTGTATYYAWRPTAATDSSGATVIAWMDSRLGISAIFAQKLDAGGAKLWPGEVHVSSGRSTPQVYPSAAADGEGKTVVVWNSNTMGVIDVIAQKLNADGSFAWGGGQQVNRVSGGRLEFPAVAVDATGSAFVAWLSSNWVNAEVYAQRLDAGGVPLWETDRRVDANQRASVQKPGAAVDENGNAYTVWQSENYSDIYVQYTDLTGNRLWPADLPANISDLFYFSEGTAESKSIDATSNPIYTATLTADYQLNSGSIRFFLSNDGARTWLEITEGVAVVFPTAGSDLRWRAVMQADPIWARTPLIHTIRMDYSTQSPYEDDYEPDAPCSAARPIAANGAAQTHTFHQAGDEDWVWFDAIANTTYIIQTTNVQANADTRLTLYGDCGQPALATDENAYGPEALLTWPAPFTGPAYVMASNQPASTFGIGTEYALVIRAYPTDPVVVIVSGHADDDSSQSNIDTTADQAYLTFLNSGVSRQNIRYLGPNPERDVDQNGFADDITATATLANVRTAVQDWARERGVRLGVPFYLYLTGPGSEDHFLANGSDQQIAADELNLWLDNLESTSGTDNINVIIEASRSGSFIDVTPPGEASISGRNRVIITSTSSSLNAYFSPQGAYFSDAFWTSIRENLDLKTAFNTARQAVMATGLNQEPWLDENGVLMVNQITPNHGGAASSDRRTTVLAPIAGTGLASERGLGAAFPAKSPVIDWARLEKGALGKGIITTKVRADREVKNVWAEIYLPGLVSPSAPLNAALARGNRLLLPFIPAGEDLFSANYQFTQGGLYRVVIYAQDQDGNQAMPRVLLKCPQCTFLPFTAR
jgi:hypothetical protein